MNLEQEVKRIAGLDAKRTQGGWKTLGEWAVVGKVETIADLYQTQFDCDKLERVANNAAFIAAAPSMAKLIAKLWEEREELREGLVKAREALGTCSTGMCDQKFDADAVNASIAYIDGLLNQPTKEASND